MASLATSELGEFAFRVLESDGPNVWLVLVSDGPLDEVARMLSAGDFDIGRGERDGVCGDLRI